MDMTKTMGIVYMNKESEPEEVAYLSWVIWRDKLLSINCPPLHLGQIKW